MAHGPDSMRAFSTSSSGGLDSVRINKSMAKEADSSASILMISMMLAKDPKATHSGGGGFKHSCMELIRMIKLHPLIAILPFVAFGLMVGLGVWGVIAASNDSALKDRDKARSTAVDVATSFELQLKEAFTPAVTLSLMIEQNPQWSFWEERYRVIAEQLIERSIPGSIYNIQLQPFGQVRFIEPMRPTDTSQPGKDLILEPKRRDAVLKVIAQHVPGINVVINYLTQATVAFVRVPVYIYGTGPNDTFGYSFPGANYTQPDFPETVYFPPVVSGTPLGYQNNCTVCYVPATATTPSERWWGFITLTINFQSLVSGNDTRFMRLSDNGLRYSLQRPLNATNNIAIVEIGDIDLANSEVVDVSVLAGVVWQLWVESDNGWDPTWKGPLIAVVVVIACVISSLCFVALLYHYRQGAMLEETMDMNAKLENTTAELEAEKARLEKTTVELEAEKGRLDSLLTRQYDLLACLDMKTLNNSNVQAKTGLTMDRIADARRMVTNAATKPGDTEIELFELLGEGSFGKVNRGMWRGIEVAVKTMILPANMPGSEKREKMAIMEAAISSSLVHPNIVTTYTYCIRPYTDGTPANEPLGESLGSLINCVPADSEVCSLANSGGAQSGTIISTADSFVHSYQVRMVLEYCDKGSLWEALEQGAFMGEVLRMAAMVETLIDVANAMVHMHAASVLHSDLKARNIMLKSSGMVGRGFLAKVCDFGLSTQMKHTETHVSSMFQGTLTHMAPEVLMEGRISKAGDVYSFGIMMWEVFTASKPFADVSKAHIGYAITKGNQRPHFPMFAPKVYKELAERCWSADAAVRPPFEEIISVLQELLKKLPPVREPLIIKPTKPLSKPLCKVVNPPTSRSGNTAGAIFLGNDQSVVLSVSKNPSVLTPVMEMAEDAEGCQVQSPS